jgi:glycosyltransferase involved in cell wall biosynthesis
MSRKTISAVIACYRDAPAVPIMHERLVAAFAEADVDYEIVFVNDGSPDNAAEVLAELATCDPHVVVVNHARAFGSQSAFTSGMRIATGDAVVLLDGDLQDPPEVIPSFVEKWKEGYDVVYGARVEREAPFHMQKLYKAFYRLFRRLAYVDVALDAGDFSLIDRRVVEAMNAMPETNRFLRGMRAWVGFRQIGIPYVRPERMFGTTTDSFRKNLGWARRAIVSFSYAPLDLITGLALVVVAASFVSLLVQLGLRIAAPSTAPKGLTTLIVLILFLGGIQLLCLAIIGSYLGHMYEEVKGRPSFVVESILNPPPGTEAPASARLLQLADQPATAVAVQPRQSTPPSPRREE